VDDQPAVRRSVAEMLEALGHTVVAAASAHDALASIEEGPCDLVVTDLAMPDMSGLALASEVRRIRPGLPVVLLTGGETPCEVRPDVIRLVLVKPVSLTVLRDAVIRAAA
jgi:CheY-like chemotaxis protein